MVTTHSSSWSSLSPRRREDREDYHFVPRAARREEHSDRRPLLRQRGGGGAGALAASAGQEGPSLPRPPPPPPRPPPSPRGLSDAARPSPSGDPPRHLSVSENGDGAPDSAALDGRERPADGSGVAETGVGSDDLRAGGSTRQQVREQAQRQSQQQAEPQLQQAPQQERLRKPPAPEARIRQLAPGGGQRPATEPTAEVAAAVPPARVATLSLRCLFPVADPYSADSHRRGPRRRRRGTAEQPAAAQAGTPPYWPRGAVPVVRVLVPPGITESELARCIFQAAGTGYDGGGWKWGGGGYNPPTVAGLFREHDGVFLPLSHVLSNPHAHEWDVFSLTRPALQTWMEVPEVGGWDWPRIVLVLVLAVAAGWVALSAGFDRGMDLDHARFVARENFDNMVASLISLLIQTVDVLIEVPLQKLYRHGPALVGWEGAPLPRICARITYHGDEDFWTRNLEECERIYRAKENAALQMRRPVLYILLAYAAFLAVRSLVRMWALRGQRRSDQDMVEMYQAFNVLVRHLQRALATRK